VVTDRSEGLAYPKDTVLLPSIEGTSRQRTMEIDRNQVSRINAT
jgi:hypothetical protein